MTSTETRHRIAVFIDFDNVEICVKSTIGGQFDIGLVLEAIKERGEIVTKIAYSDWKRVGDYSRLLTQHAIRMTPEELKARTKKFAVDVIQFARTVPQDPIDREIASQLTDAATSVARPTS